MVKRKMVTKQERRQILGIILGIAAYSFIQEPMYNIVKKVGLGDFGMVLAGLGFLFLVYYMIEM